MSRQEKNPFSINAEYAQSRLMLPFENISAVWWRESEIHRHVPVFSIDLQLKYPASLPLRQIAGHRIGSRLFPQHIDPPLCIWVKKNRENVRYVPVGYSVPFISGTPIKIGINPKAKKLAETIEQNFGLYVGNKGDSENAIIEPNENIKFVDVEIRPKLK